jgi:GcrA cell cycle regulator
VTWTQEREEHLTALWALGKSASEIMREMGGTSRSAVIGKARRMGLPSRSSEEVTRNMRRLRHGDARGGAAVVTKAKAAKPAAEKVRRVIEGPKTVSALRMKPMPKAEPGRLIDATLAKLWTERAFGECAYPVAGEGADTFSCCMDTGGATYCAGHAGIMFDVRPRRSSAEPSRRRRAA